MPPNIGSNSKYHRSKREQWDKHGTWIIDKKVFLDAAPCE